MNNVEQHDAVCRELNQLYKQKNQDYGDSFHETFLEEGMAMSRIRLTDKLNRFKKLTRHESVQNVANESVRDTLIDLANYAIMTVMELDREVPFMPKTEWSASEVREAMSKMDLCCIKAEPEYDTSDYTSKFRNEWERTLGKGNPPRAGYVKDRMDVRYSDTVPGNSNVPMSKTEHADTGCDWVKEEQS